MAVSPQGKRRRIREDLLRNPSVLEEDPPWSHQRQAHRQGQRRRRTVDILWDLLEPACIIAGWLFCTFEGGGLGLLGELGAQWRTALPMECNAFVS